MNVIDPNRLFLIEKNRRHSKKFLSTYLIDISDGVSARVVSKVLL